MAKTSRKILLIACSHQSARQYTDPFLKKQNAPGLPVEGEID
jgi:hypothetical protein